MKSIELDGHQVKYLVSYPTAEVIRFSPATATEQRRLSSRYKGCYQMVWFKGIGATWADTHIELRCGAMRLNWYSGTRKELDSLLARFKAAGEHYVIHIYRL